MTKLETEFTMALIAAIEKAEALTGTGEPRLLAQAQKDGGPKAVRQLLSRGQTTRQFEPLKQLGHLELTPEALVIQGKYGSLFSDDEVNRCLEVLLSTGMFERQ